MTKTVSARISDKLFDQLRELCNSEGCSVNDFVKGWIERGVNEAPKTESGQTKQHEQGNNKGNARTRIDESENENIPTVVLRL